MSADVKIALISPSNLVARECAASAEFRRSARSLRSSLFEHDTCPMYMYLRNTVCCNTVSI